MSSGHAFAPPSAFANRTVIVTGGAGSIGKPLCLAFARAGANVVVNDLGGNVSGTGSSTAPAHDVTVEIQREGGSAVADTHSVTEAEKIIETALREFGRIDIIINSAGIIHYGPLEAQTPEIFRRVFEVNALGAMALLHHAWPYFQTQSYGRVVNFTSGSVFGMPNSTSYVLSRGAMLGVTKTLALEGAAHNILVNTVGPTSYSRMVADLISDLPAEQQDAMKSTYSGDSNVPLILALAHESNNVSGEIFNTGGYAIGRMALSTVSEIKDCRTMGEVQKQLTKLLEPGRESIEPKSIQDYMAFRAQMS